MIRLSPDEKCRCASGRVLRSCCLTVDGALRPVAAVTSPLASKRGIRNDGYAAALADCSADISREHYISHALLRLLSIEGRVTVGHAYRPQGLRFMTDSCEKVIHFGWDDGLPHRGATIEYQTAGIRSQL